MNVYSLEWTKQHNIDFDESIIAAAPYGGPIAVCRDERKALLLSSSSSSAASKGVMDVSLRSSMRIFSSAGKLMSQFSWDYAGLVKDGGLGWTETENLVAVLR